MNRNIFVILFNILPNTLEIRTFSKKEKKKRGKVCHYELVHCVSVCFNTKELLLAEQ
jgi:hypothetical protein